MLTTQQLDFPIAGNALGGDAGEDLLLQPAIVPIGIVVRGPTMPDALDHGRRHHAWCPAGSGRPPVLPIRNHSGSESRWIDADTRGRLLLWPVERPDRRGARQPMDQDLRVLQGDSLQQQTTPPLQAARY